MMEAYQAEVAVMFAEERPALLPLPGQGPDSVPVPASASPAGFHAVRVSGRGSAGDEHLVFFMLL